MAPCFRSEAEEEEEKDGANWSGPTSKLETDDDAIIHPPQHRRDRLNAGEVVVSFLPADPWLQGLCGYVVNHQEN